MDKIKNLIVPGIVSLVVALLVVIGGSGQTSTQTPNPPNTGGAALADVPSPYFNINDVRRWFHRQALITSTTTVCAIQAPAATSTLVLGGIRLDTSTTTISSVTLAKAATAFATTTTLSKVGVAANAQAMIVASSTTGLSDFIFGPNEWFVVGMQGGLGGSFSPTGICQATFEEF